MSCRDSGRGRLPGLIVDRFLLIVATLVLLTMYLIVNSNDSYVNGSDRTEMPANVSPGNPSVSSNDKNYENSNLRVVTSGHTKPVTAAAFSHSGAQILTSSEDHTVLLWDANAGEELLRIEVDGTIPSVVFSPDDRQFLTGNSNGKVELWETSAGKKLQQFSGTFGVFSPDGSSVVTLSDSNASVCDISTGKEMRRFDGNFGTMAFSTDGRQLITVDRSSRVVRFWDLETEQQMRKIMLDQEATETFSLDEKRLLAVFAAGSDAILWDLQSGEEVRRFIGHSDHVNSVAFSSDGRTL